MSAKRIVFTDEEKDILLALVSASISIVEDKKNDCNALAIKKKEWNNITEKFNSHCNVRCCTSAQLKKCWMNIKERSKKEVAREKRERRMTGGGPPPAAVDPMSQKVYDLIPAQFEPLDNPYDDDKPVISVAAGSAVEVVDVDDDASAFAKAIQKEIFEFTSLEEQPPSIINNRDSNKENKAPTHTSTHLEPLHIVDHNVKTAAKLNTSTLFTPNSKPVKRKSSVSSEEAFLTQQRLEHELRMKKWRLEMDYAKEEHIVKMRQLTTDLNEPFAAHCSHGHD